jgi:hypothetical protein
METINTMIAKKEKPSIDAIRIDLSADIHPPNISIWFSMPGVLMNTMRVALRMDFCPCNETMETVPLVFLVQITKKKQREYKNNRPCLQGAAG